jgi:adenylate cyclase
VSHENYEFGDFCLDVRSRRLVRRADGEIVPLTPRAYDTLLYLVEHAGSLVDKSTLLAALWPNAVVEENSLNKQISVVRRALGDDTSAYIATVPGRGYQFVAAISEPGAASAAGETRRASVAVLPFANLTGDPAKHYWALGLADELLDALARVPRLAVPARTSSFAYQGRALDVRQIARELGVATVLEGSVRSAGERIRVTAQLVDGRTGYHVWSQTFDRRAVDLFELQDELARAIVQALRVEFDQSLPAIPRMVLPPTRDLEAYRMYLEGAALTAPATIGDHERSRALMRQAAERDPEFAHAHAGLAFTEATGVFLGLLPLSTLAGTEGAARRALALDSRLAIAHAALAMVAAMRGRFVDAERGFREARALDEGNPQLVHCHLFFVHEPVGRVRLAYEESLDVHRAAPAWVPGAMHLAVAAMLADRSADEVRDRIETAIALGFPPTRPPIPELRAELALTANDLHAARECIGMEPATADAVRDQREALRQMLRVAANPAAKAGAIALLDERARALGNERPEHPSWIHLVMTYAQLGDFDRAFDCAHRAIDAARRFDSIGVHWGLLWIPRMRAFRTDRRFTALAERLGLAEFWDACGPPDAAG